MEKIWWFVVHFYRMCNAYYFQFSKYTKYIIIRYGVNLLYSKNYTEKIFDEFLRKSEEKIKKIHKKKKYNEQ